MMTDAWSQDIQHIWSLTQAPTTHHLTMPATEQYYQGTLSFSDLPYHMVTLGWQDEQQQDHVLLHTQQNQVTIYWHKPDHAVALWLRSSKAQPLDAHLALTAKPLYPPVTSCLNDQPQSQALTRLMHNIHQHPQQKAEFLNTFWQQAMPIVEPLNQDFSRVVYAWRAARHNVRLLGGPSNDHEWLQRLPDTDIWYREYVVPAHYRGSYVYAVDVPNITAADTDCTNADTPESRAQRLAILSVLQLDPRNRHTLMPKHQANAQRNENVMVLQPDTRPSPSPLVNTPNPSLTSHRFQSHILDNQRHIDLYQAPLARKDQPVTTLIFLDGEQYTHSINTPLLLSQWMAEQRISTVQAAFIHNPSAQARMSELAPNAAFVDMFDRELMPYLHQQFQHRIDPHRTIIIGSSFGGLAAAHLGLQLPQHFSYVVALSGSFWWQKPHAPADVQPFIAQHVTAQPTLPNLKWFLSAGSDENTRQQANILQSTEQLQHVLQNRQQQVHHQVYAGGHNYVVWQHALQDALWWYLGNKPENKSK